MSTTFAGTQRCRMIAKNQEGRTARRFALPGASFAVWYAYMCVSLSLCKWAVKYFVK